MGYSEYDCWQFYSVLTEKYNGKRLGNKAGNCSYIFFFFHPSGNGGFGLKIVLTYSCNL